MVCEAASALIIAMMRADSRHNLSGAFSPRTESTGCGGRGTAPEPGLSWTVRRCRRPKMPVDCRQRCLASSCDTSAHSVCMAANREHRDKDVMLLSASALQPSIAGYSGIMDIKLTFKALMSTLSAICLFLC